jgi:hypothetical protein
VGIAHTNQQNPGKVCAVTGRHIQRLFGLATLALGLLWVGTSRAEEKARLVYARGAGATGCPAEIELRLWVVARLGYDPFSPQASRVLLARVEQRAGRLFGTVELIDRDGLTSGRREVSSLKSRCDELSRTMALTISLTIDAERAAAAQSQTAGRVGLLVETSSDEPAEDDAGLPHRLQDVRLFAGGSLAGAARLLPTFALGGEGYVGIGWRKYSLRLEARAMRSFYTDLPIEGSLSGETIDAGLVGCRSHGPFGLCLVTQLGIERVQSTGLGRPHTVTALHGAAGPRLSLYFPQTPRLSMVFGVECLLNLSRNHARMASRDVWKSPLFSGTLLIGAETDFL